MSQNGDWFEEYGITDPYYADKWRVVVKGDSLSVLPRMPSDSVDLVVTDPPYGISFMGKDWDKALPDKQIWQECFRLLKPGAFAFVMSIPRADCLSRVIISLEDAGFMVNFTPIFWAYASGFPKAQNIGKAVDKRGGVSVSWFGEWLREWRLEKGITQKEIAKLFPSKTGGLTGCVANWELGFNMPTPQEFTTICRHFALPFDSLEEAEREVISRQPMTIGIGGNSPRMGSEKVVDLPSTPQAKALDGSYGGFQPKPAVEVTIVAMKPLSEKTFVGQALKNRKGIAWLDDCRIPYESEDDLALQQDRFKGHKNPTSHSAKSLFTDIKDHSLNLVNPSGRFPANLLVSDDVLNDGRDRQAGSYKGEGSKSGGIWQPSTGKPAGKEYGDSGSFSRYFDLDKWAQKTFPFLIVPKASKSEKNRGLSGSAKPPILGFRPTLESNPENWKTLIQDTPYGGANRAGNQVNNHPTVKPLKLMSYLITLGSRGGDIVLDPFSGSGTTPLACGVLNRCCLALEIKKEYCEIVARRCGADTVDRIKRGEY